jgi:hypothetical protein
MTFLFYSSFIGVLAGYLFRLTVIVPYSSKNNVVDSYVLQQHNQQQYSTKLCFPQRALSPSLIPYRYTRTNSKHHEQSRKYQSFSSARLSSSSTNNNEATTRINTNEFSRIVPVDRVLFRQRSGSSSIANEYNVNIEATNDECIQLAKRFEIHSIHQLQASVCLRSHNDRGRSAASNSNNKYDVEVDGTVTATVTQRCVRTNESFNSTIEFPIYCLVRPAIPVMGLLKLDMMNDLESIDDESISSKTKKSKTGGNAKGASDKGSSNKKKKNYQETTSSIIDDMDVQQLQRLLEQNIDSNDNNNNDLSIMEDEFIYSTSTSNIFDIGELISQVFWLELDPYPKKPGTGPVQFSISG